MIGLKNKTNFTLMALAALLLPRLALAEDALNGADTAWIMTSTALVLFMTLSGLALFYGGLVRNKNVLSVLLQCFGIAGMVAGLGTITPASGFVGPGGALIIGLLAGGVCFTATQYIKRVLKIDDSLDVFPVHGVGGTLGTLLAGVFSATGLGVFSGYGFAEGIETMGGQFSVQFIGVASTIVYTAAATWIILKVVEVLTRGLRVGEDQEIEGLDIAAHEERGYDLH